MLMLAWNESLVSGLRKENGKTVPGPPRLRTVNYMSYERLIPMAINNPINYGSSKVL